MSKSAKLADLTPDRRNANKGTIRGRKALDESLRKYGAGRSILVDKNGRIIAGNKTAEIAGEIGLDDVIVVPTDGHQLVAVQRTDLDLDEEAARMLAYYDNRTGQLDLEWDAEQLQLDISAGLQLDGLFDGDELKDILGNLIGEPPEDPGAQIDRAEELRQQWGVELGQLWRIPSKTAKGEHRVVCGDCTDREVVGRVMGEEKAKLCHADPPYGMGKENDGIENDNLYKENLDDFQMAWWIAGRPFISENGSVYIWGNAEDLWRFWYRKLKDSERLTFRNEIVWEKHGAQGIKSETHRMYPTSSERCIFFMLGEQGFSTNANNYWDGWTPIVNYLEEQRQLMGWSIKDTKRIAGHSESSGCHWFDKSQWTMPTRDTYEAWQKEARRDKCFFREYEEIRREYEEIRREFYSTRAYFDNTHDAMTDVWNFSRVIGDERQGHATPKPVEMAERAINSSAPSGSVVYVPFGGTFPEFIACERLARLGRGVEISPGYIGVALQRLADMGLTPELIG